MAHSAVMIWRCWRHCSALLIDSDESAVIQLTAVVLGFMVAHTYQPPSCFAYMQLTTRTANAPPSRKACCWVAKCNCLVRVRFSGTVVQPYALRAKTKEGQSLCSQCVTEHSASGKALQDGRLARAFRRWGQWATLTSLPINPDAR